MFSHGCISALGGPLRGLGVLLKEFPKASLCLPWLNQDVDKEPRNPGVVMDFSPGIALFSRYEVSRSLEVPSNFCN